ncbi:MAG: hypothetical protein Q7T01_04445 [bacterium]|nr:hypothetical protein [bacterium]
MGSKDILVPELVLTLQPDAQQHALRIYSARSQLEGLAEGSWFIIAVSGIAACVVAAVSYDSGRRHASGNYIAEALSFFVPRPPTALEVIVPLLVGIVTAVIAGALMRYLYVRPRRSVIIDGVRRYLNEHPSSRATLTALMERDARIRRLVHRNMI